MKRLNWVVTGVAILSLAIILLTGCGVPKSEYEALQANNQILKAEKEDLETKVTDLQNTLTQIRKVYPLKEFSSPEELKSWISLHDVSKRQAQTAEALIGKALLVQRWASEEGYIISVLFTYTPFCGGSAAPSAENPQNCWFVECMTIIDGYIWVWPINSPTQLTQISTLGKVE